MPLLKVTLIDVGWGDSILLESTDQAGVEHFALIDSNDTTYQRSSFTFLRRHFEKKGVDPRTRPVFDLVALTHEHADHAQGLKLIMREFGTRRFVYPASTMTSVFAELVRFATRSPAVLHHEPVDSGTQLPNLGDATMDILWPPAARNDPNPNDNSLVLLVRLGAVAILVTGDAEAGVWARIAGTLPPDLAFVKVPHHGAEDATFGAAGSTPWLDRCPPSCTLAISSHVLPYRHPHQSVINELNRRGMRFYRTDRDYHVTFETNGTTRHVSYYHH